VYRIHGNRSKNFHHSGTTRTARSNKEETVWPPTGLYCSQSRTERGVDIRMQVPYVEQLGKTQDAKAMVCPKAFPRHGSQPGSSQRDQSYGSALITNTTNHSPVKIPCPGSLGFRS
jgi:hypothetical protein